MMSGKIAMVCGFGDVGKGSAASLRNAGCRVMVSEIDPICALQAAMEGYEVVDHGGRGAARRHLRHRDRQRRRHHHRPHARDEGPRHRLQHRPLRHARSRSRALRNFKWHNVKPQVDEIEFPDGKRIILLSEGRLVNLGNATGHPSFVMSASLHQPDAGADRALDQARRSTRSKVYTLPKELDEKVARAASRQDRRQADQAQRQAGRPISASPQAGPVQAGPLPLLSRPRRGHVAEPGLEPRRFIVIGDDAEASIRDRSTGDVDVFIARAASHGDSAMPLELR